MVSVHDHDHLPFQLFADFKQFLHGAAQEFFMYFREFSGQAAFPVAEYLEAVFEHFRDAMGCFIKNHRHRIAAVFLHLLFPFMRRGRQKADEDKWLRN